MTGLTKLNLNAVIRKIKKWATAERRKKKEKKVNVLNLKWNLFF